MWLTADIVGWIKSQGVSTAVVAGPYMPPLPERLVVVTRTSGPGLSTEGALDTTGFQVRTRGSGGYSANGEADAYLIDQLILFGDWPPNVKMINRSGGPPVPLAPAPDSGERITWVCSYLPTLTS